MNDKGYQRIVGLRDFWEIFRARVGWLLIAFLLVAAGLKLGSATLVEKKYESTATLYILRRENEPNYIYTQSDFSLAKDVVNDCTYVLKSGEVLEKVIRELDLDVDPQYLSKLIRANNPDNTRFLEVTVEAYSPEMAKRVVDCVCDLSAKKITESMGFEQINLYAYGTMPDRPSNQISTVGSILGGIIAAIIVYTAFLIAFLFDTSIQTEEDIAKYLNLSMLAEIPNNKTGKRSGGKKYRYRSAYKYRNQTCDTPRSEKGGKAR